MNKIRDTDETCKACGSTIRQILIDTIDPVSRMIVRDNEWRTMACHCTDVGRPVPHHGSGP